MDERIILSFNEVLGRRRCWWSAAYMGLKHRHLVYLIGKEGMMVRYDDAISCRLNRS